MAPRRKSVDSGSSGEESGGSNKKKDKKEKKDKDSKDKGSKDKDKSSKDHKDKDKDKKDKDKKDKDKSEKDKASKDKDKDSKDKDKSKDGKVGGHKDVAGSGFAANAQAPMYKDHHQFSSPPIVPPHFDANRGPGYPDAPPPFPGAPPSFPGASPSFPGTPPASNVQGGAAPPPSGYRIPLSTTEAFPNPQQTGQPPFWDADGSSPVFIGSALFETSVHPCKIGPHLQPFASVAFGGGEHGHHGRFDLLPFVPATMEWVATSYGRIPPGRRPIEGGYEESSAKLYHGAALVNGIRIPGKTGEHLNGCNVAFGGSEIAVADHEILCWR